MISVCLSVNILVNLVNLRIKVLELGFQSGHSVFSGFLFVSICDIIMMLSIMVLNSSVFYWQPFHLLLVVPCYFQCVTSSWSEFLLTAYISTGQIMGWGNKAIEIRAAETGHLDGVFMHKKAQKLKFLCERNDKVCIFWSSCFMIRLQSISKNK